MTDHQSSPIDLERFKSSLESSPIVRMGSYDYFVNPVTDGIPKMDPRVLAEVLDAFKEIGDFHCDVIVSPEAMGIPLAVPLSLELGIPYSVVRKKRYGLPGEVAVSQVTGYSKGHMYVNGIGKGDKVVVIDDVVSTGGTLLAVIKALRHIGAEIVDVIVAVEKGEGKAALEREVGIRVKSLVRVEIREGRLKVLS
ncbi:MAG: adenine phosphoribosyltransferase [Methanomassiliicoccales archaeon]|jgi:adenine phosphoribosyltransferase|nr:adenine phosphoribosyltransferase [Methanomassiliicoccales archaeon]MDD1756263.1 adenine phosphoribosyltransferase [Methanomassiliicoccales archaeon]